MAKKTRFSPIGIPEDLSLSKTIPRYNPLSPNPKGLPFRFNSSIPSCRERPSPFSPRRALRTSSLSCGGSDISRRDKKAFLPDGVLYLPFIATYIVELIAAGTTAGIPLTSGE